VAEREGFPQTLCHGLPVANLVRALQFQLERRQSVRARRIHTGTLPWVVHGEGSQGPAASAEAQADIDIIEQRAD
jgi:hypothetical protein